MWPNDGVEQCSVFPRQPFQLSLGQLGCIHRDAAFTPAIGNIHYRTLEGHSRGQGFHLVHVHTLVIPDAAFIRAPDPRMLHPVTLKYFDRSVVHPNRHGNLKFPFRVFQLDVVPLFQTQQGSCSIHGFHDFVVGIVVFAHPNHHSSLGKLERRPVRHRSRICSLV